MKRIIFCCAVLLPVVLTAQSAWSNFNTPVATVLQCISVPSASTWFAAGDSGLVVKTTNSGASWSTLSSGTQYTINGIHFRTATTGAFVSDSGIIRKTTNGGGSWTTQNSNTTTRLNAIEFYTNNVAFVCGDSGRFMYTYDGGTTWNLSSIATNQNLTDLSFGTGWGGYAVGTGGVIYVTYDDGVTWQAQTSGTTENLNSVEFVDRWVGFCVGNNGTMLRTTDEGVTWTAVAPFTSANLTSITFRSDLAGYCCTDSGSVFATTDGGVHWEFIYAAPQCTNEIDAFNGTVAACCDSGMVVATVDAFDWVQNYNFTGAVFAMDFVNDSTGYAALSGGDIIVTNDGQNWSLLYSSGSAGIFSIDFVDAETGYFAKQQDIYVTTDSGATWTIYNFPGWSFAELDFVSRDTGFARLSSGGSILKTVDGGQNWVPLAFSFALTDIEFLDPDTGFVAGGGTFAAMHRTTDGGATWTEMFSTSAYDFHSIRIPNRRTIFLWDDRALMRSDDGGRNFHPVSCPYATGNYIGSDLVFTDSLTGYFAGNYSSGNSCRVYKTMDGGDTWFLQTQAFTNSGSHILNFPDANTGYFTTFNHIMKNVNYDSSLANNQLYPPDTFVRDVAPAYDWILQQNSNSGLVGEVTCDHSGHTIAVGKSHGTFAIGSYSITSPYGLKAVLAVVKCDSMGQILWVTPFFGGPTSTTAWANSVSTDGADNIYVSGDFGYSLYYGTDSLTSPSVGHFHIKLDSAGNIVWAVSFEPNNNYTAIYSCADTAGNLFVTGSYMPPATFGSFTLTSGLCYVAKLDPQGNVLWATSNTDAHQTKPASCAVTPDGNVVVGGTFDQRCTFPPFSDTSSFTKGMFVSQFDGATGSTLWLRTADGVLLEDQVTDAACDAFGNVYVVGNYEASCRFDSAVWLSAIDQSGLFYAKYNSTGQLIWLKKIHHTIAGKIDVDSLGRVFIAGETYQDAPFADTLIPGQTCGVIVIFCADENGNVLWVKKQETPFINIVSDNAANGIALDDHGNCYVTSALGGYGIDSVGTCTIPPGGNAWVYGHWAKIYPSDFPVGIEDSSGTVTGQPFLLFPSPADRNITVEFAEQKENAAYEIFNAQGALVRQAPINGESIIQVSTEDLEPGVYFFVIRGSEYGAKKFEIVH